MADLREAKGKLRIVSDGTPVGTKVLLPDGTPLAAVTYVAWEIGTRGFAEATVKFLCAPIDVTAEAKPETGD